VIRYIIVRLLQAIPTVVLASIFVFLLIHLVPGDPALILAGPDPTPEVVAAIRQKMGLDQSLPVQYLTWAGNALHGDLGVSYINQYPTWELVMLRAPASFELLVAGFTLSLLVALPLGILASLRQHSRIDMGISIYTSVALGIPNFWLGILLILLFSLGLGWLPPGGRVPSPGGPPGEDGNTWLCRSWRWQLPRRRFSLGSCECPCWRCFMMTIYEPHERRASRNG